MWISSPITTVHDEHICHELTAVARISLAILRWLSDRSKRAAVVLGNHPISVRSILNGWVGTKLDELPPQSKKNLDGYHRKMNPHHEAMVRLDYHGAQ